MLVSTKGGVMDAKVLSRSDLQEHTGNGRVVYGAEAKVEPPRVDVKAGRIWGVLRIAMGLTFFWAFLDKAFALGFATGRNPDTGAIDFFGKDAWIHGASPTDGALTFALRGPFKSLYSGLVGQTWIEWVYMASMLLIGVALVLGLGTRLAALGGIAWMGIFYTATAIWPDNNPFLDEHIVYIIVLAGIAYVGAGRYLGLQRYWDRLSLVKRFPILK
jgi:thiosulfate dehydrogenase [quinone] large subunit